VTEGIRLQKLLSRAGRASRREAERLMQEGRVRVNGEVVSELGTRVVPGRDVVEVDGARVDEKTTAPVWVAFHKPAGVLTTRRDPGRSPTVYDVLPRELSRLKYVGRLDRDTEGLLLLTDDGDAAHKLQHPSGEVEREYRVEVAGRVERASVRRLIKGIQLDDGPAAARGVTLLESGPTRSTLTVVLTEGRKREVRRMMKAIGHRVLALRRTRFGTVRLGDLEAGAWRRLDEDEVRSLLE
jgi:pseudouridine synthase